MGKISDRLGARDYDEIETLAGLGMRFEDIALVKGMSADTLTRLADDRLQLGRAKAKSQVMQTAYKMAVSGKQPAMTMFWLKTKANWRENAPEQAQGVSGVLEQLQASRLPSQLLVGFLASIMGQIARGEIDPATAGSISVMANTMMKASSQGELEDRMQQLETLMQAQQPKALDIEL